MAMRTAPCPLRHAFSLVEMAIVLTIIGLLVGAVVGGKKLLRQSELQTIISTDAKYMGAFAQFKQQFGSYPGDMLDAQSYFGTAVNGVSITNGNGDGAINSGDEPYQAWEHLMLAKFIEGTFTGTTSGGGASLGVNVPKGRISNSGWSFWYKGTTSGDAVWYDQDLSNMLAFGGPNAGSISNGAVLLPAEAWQIDTKIDDGLPAVGTTVALKPSGTSPTPNCTTSTTDSSAQYNNTYPNIACSLAISLGGK